MDKWFCTKCGKKEIPQDTEYCEECAEDSFKKIGGWLYLPAIGLIFSVIFIIFQIVVAVHTIPRVSYYSTLQNTVIFTLVANIILLLLTIYTAIQFFNKLKKAPRLYILLRLLNIVFQIITVYLIVDGLGESMTYSLMAPVLQQGITAAIWIPYFMVSVRVRKTFVN
ncbi:hypothetical protein Xmau_00943 [Xenorhabdus mauleonii]|uniref:DUF2569 domain-containing protein n=1 Tax=Xenorhabdus mauleonii TaxID=351675 RepID=A0A1I3LT48_9GAMM|nr:DUF2569 family protein [Xenorhabdus mauleonii]PHM45293.1 hypothetical protein Xmau_00943 [Xenorhabdus mauleonii]SFI87919.1 Protein of unknown function [Xenorhabdus mauleonii]